MSSNGASDAAPSAAPRPERPAIARERSPSRARAERTLDDARRSAAKGDLPGSIKFAERAIGEDPTLEAAYLLLGSACAMSGDPSCELDAYARGVKALPQSAQLHAEIGVVHLGRNEIAEAVAALEHARELSSSREPTILADLAYAYAFSGRVADAERIAKESRRLDPRCFQCAMSEGEVLRRLEKHEESVNAFRAAVQLSPRDPAARVSLAKSLHRAGRSDEALAAYDSLLTEIPEEPALLTQSGQVLIALDRFSEACARLERAAEKVDEAPGRRAILELLLDAQMKAKDTKGAARTRRRLSERD